MDRKESFLPRLRVKKVGESLRRTGRPSLRLTNSLRRTEREQERIHAGLQLEGAAEAMAGRSLVAEDDAEAANRALNKE